MKRIAVCACCVMTLTGTNMQIPPSAVNAAEISKAGSEEALYGLSLELSADTMYVGEVRQLSTFVDAEYYQPDWVIQSENNDIAAVYFDGHIFANKSGTASLYIRAKLDPEKVDLAPDDNGVRTVTATITVADDPALTDTQQAALEPIELKETRVSCQLSRAKAEIKGILAADAPRLTLDEVNQMIAGSDSFETLFRKITDAQPYPDFYDDMHVLYFFDDKGTERIRINLHCSGKLPHEIIYERLNQNGVAENPCYLYPESRVNEVISIDPNPALKDWYYCFMNDIPRGILKGDANNDGKVDAADAVYLQKWLLVSGDAQDINGETADMNQDGTLNAIDLCFMKKELLRLGYHT